MKRQVLLRLVGQNGGGGARIHVWQLNRKIRENGIFVSTLIPTPRFRDMFTSEEFNEGYINSRSHVDFVFKAFSLAWRADAVHSHLRNAHVVGAVISGLLRKPHLMTVHAPLLTGRRSAREWIMKLTLRWAARRASAVIFISNFIKLHALNALLLDDSDVNSIVIYNGSDDPGSVGGFCYDKFVICMVGELTDRKGMGNLVELVGELHGRGLVGKVEVRVYGDGPWRGRLEKMAAGNPILRLMGYQTDQDAIYSQSNLNMMLGKDEAFGRTVTEAKSYGIASLCWHAGAFPELISHAADGYLVKSVTEAADLISELVVTPSLASDLGLNARKSFEANFSVEEFSTQTMLAVKRALNW